MTQPQVLLPAAALGGATALAGFLTADLITVTQGVGVFCLLLLGVALCCYPKFRAPYVYGTIALTFLDVSPISYGGSFVRIYQFASLLLPFCLISSADGARQNKISPMVGLFLLLNTLLVVLSLEWTISRRDTIHVSLGQCYLLILLGLVVILLARNVITVERTLAALLVGCTICSLTAMVQFGLSLIGVERGVLHVVGIPWARPSGLMLEPDWSGLVAGMGFLLATLGPRPTVARRRRWGSIAFAVAAVINVGVIGLTAVRSVAVALIVTAVGLSLMRGVPRQVRKTSAGILLVLVLGGAALFILAPSTAARYDPRHITEGVVDQGAANSRLGSLRLIQDQGPDRLWRGHGAGSINYASSLPENALKYGGGGVLNGGHGSTNLFATNFYDLGLPGLTTMFIAVMAWLWKSFKIRVRQPILLALSLFLVTAFQLTNGFRFGFVWILLAVASVGAPTNNETEESPGADHSTQIMSVVTQA